MADERLDILADSVDTMACPKCGTVIDVRGLELFSSILCPDCDAALTVPAQFGQFLLVSVLGRGGMGAVYKALDQSLNRHVAIKVMRQEYGEDSQFLQSFLREAQAAAALNHRNVAQVYSFGQERGQPYIVMELVEGGRLDEWIERGKTIDESSLVDIGLHIAEGLSAAKEAGLVHGDIKPANILFDAKGVAKLADFGLASFVKKQQEQPGEVWGTPYYIPPEKVRLKPSDHRADIYSLGGTLFHALVGKPPFQGANAREVVKARLNAPPPDPRDVRDGLTKTTADVLRRMLEEKPALRYPTYASLLADLKKAHRAALKHEKEERERVVVEKQWKASARSRIIGLVSLVLLLVGGGAWWWMTQRDTDPDREVLGLRLDLATGEPVPIYADEGEDGTSAGVQPPKAELDASTRTALDEAVALIVAGQTAAAQQRLSAQVESLDPLAPDRYPLRLAQAMASWAAGAPGQGAPYLQDITEAPPLADGEQPVGASDGVRAIAAFLSRTIALADLDRQAKGWTAGTQAVANLAAALTYIQQPALDNARVRLEFVEGASVDREDWARPFQRLATALLAELDDWDALQSRLTERDARGSLAALEEYRQTHGSLLAALVHAATRKYQDLKMQRQKASAARQALARKEARDLARIEAARTRTVEPIKRRDFQSAAGVVAEAGPDLESDMGREALQLERDRMERLVSLHAFIIDGINQAPVNKPLPELGGGRLTRADSKGIYAAAVDGGTSVSWDRVSAGLYLSLFNYYVRKSGLSAEQQADLEISMALYCYRNNAIKPASRYVDAALKLNPGAVSVIADVLPELAPEPAAEVTPNG